MGVPLTQMLTVTRYVWTQRLRGRARYPLVLMLEPLLRCNLACAGCGKIQHPAEILRRQLSPQQCFEAVDQCGAPIVSIPGGEPLLHPQIVEIVQGLVARRKFVYLCTNALKLEEALPRFQPSKYLAFSVHLDGPREVHDRAVCREGVYQTAVAAMQAARQRGFRLTTNTTLFNDADPEAIREHFDTMMRLGVEGMMISPGYRYEKAPDQQHFLRREETHQMFRRLLAGMRGRGWRFNQTPLFLEFLKGNWQLDCTPWGNPTYNVFGWQKPCYLVDEGYCQTFDELLASCDWDGYGHASGNPKCRDCLVHSGFEPSAVHATFNSWRGFWTTCRLVLFGPRDADLPSEALASEDLPSDGDSSPPAHHPQQPTPQRLGAPPQLVRWDGGHWEAPRSAVAQPDGTAASSPPSAGRPHIAAERPSPAEPVRPAGR